jgi:release factor glutamine methyltransferase
MTVREALRKGIDLLKAAGKEEAAADAGVLLCFLLGRNKAFMYAHSQDELPDGLNEQFFHMIEKRAAGMPVQYITGHQEFMSLDFEVNPSVLIPRHDTEILVETVIGYIRQHDITGARILDIGTGSGCIAVSLAHYMHDCQVTAVDISRQALETASVNAGNNNTGDRIEFVYSDLFSGLQSRKTGSGFDVIVSNPPYIAAGDIGGLQAEVGRYEPLAALNGGSDGLDFYRSIIKEAPPWLKHGGLLAVEVGFGQAASVSDLMKEDYYDIRIIKDLSQIDRVVAGRVRYA